MAKLKAFFTQLVYVVASFLPQSWVFGRTFRQAKALFERFDSSQNKQTFIDIFTQQQLERVISLANACDYYKKQVLPSNIQHWPFIDKDIVLNNQRDLLRTKNNADLMTTGGSSGQALAFYINKNRKGIEWFWITQGWKNVGFDRKHSWRAVLRNHHLPDRQYQVNTFLKEVCFDNFRLDDNYMKLITAEIEKRQIEYVHAYPSAAYMLALFWSKVGNVPNCVKAFLCGSEMVFPHQKQLIQQVLGLRMYTWYGHSEKLILAQEGHTCENYHVIPFYGFAELIDSEGNAVTTPGQQGELVGTGYINDKSCFVRYQTGDHAEYVGHTCPDCGHIGLTFKATVGRQGDKLYLSDGTFVTTTALNLHDEIYTHIDGMQYFQEQMGLAELRVIPNARWTSNSGEALLQILQQKVSDKLIFKLKIVEKLTFTANGKYQLVVQKVKV